MRPLALDPLLPRRRPSLTPMIDVVFLLVVFFMLAARFGLDGALPLATAGGAADYSGPPRLVEVAPDGLRLNGSSVAEADLAAALAALMEGNADTVVLRPRDGADTERLVAVIEALRAAGLKTLAIVE
jgi:biopolymer transport protein ExbD